MGIGSGSHGNTGRPDGHLLHLLGLLFVGIVRVGRCVGRALWDGKLLADVDAGAGCPALHFQLLGLALAFLGSLELFVLVSGLSF